MDSVIRPLDSCLVCGAHDLVPFLDLGQIPLVNSFLKDVRLLKDEKKYPLRVCHCSHCSHVQLSHSVSPEKLFSEYIYFTGSSESVVQHAKRLTEIAHREIRLRPESLVVEIASNDGTVLKAFQELPVDVLGVEPAGNVALAAQEAGVPTMTEFFDDALARELRSRRGGADLLLARNVLAHVPGLRGFATGVGTLLTESGAAFIEVPYLVDLLEHLEFDTIYHEHLSYFSVQALDRLFGDAGLELYDVERIRMHGGSLLLKLQRQGGPRARRESVASFLRNEAESGALELPGLQSFARKVDALRQEIREFVPALESRPRAWRATVPPRRASS